MLSILETCSSLGKMSVFRSSPSKVARKFWDFTRPADLVLIVDGLEYFVHKYILTKSSPVFQIMLESNHFKESNMEKIELPDKKGEDIQQLLNFLYPFGHHITGEVFHKNKPFRSPRTIVVKPIF